MRGPSQKFGFEQAALSKVVGIKERKPRAYENSSPHPSIRMVWGHLHILSLDLKVGTPSDHAGFRGTFENSGMDLYTCGFHKVIHDLVKGRRGDRECHKINRMARSSKGGR